MSLPFEHTFTVFTPTFNRAHTLHRVYESLAAQTCRDFEWLVVDDGSTDNTRELVESWARAAPFAIRYIRQENQGKHVAHDVAVSAAKGSLFITLDDDDACRPRALEQLLSHWQNIPERERAQFSGVTVRCVDQHGHPVGDTFPCEVFDATLRDFLYRYKIRGEHWGFQRTDVLRQHPYAAAANRGYVPDGLVWHRIGLTYRMRFAADTLRVYYRDAHPSLTARTFRAPAGHAYGRRLYYAQVLDHDMSYLPVAPVQLMKAAIQFALASLQLRSSIHEQWRTLTSTAARALWVAALPIAVVVHQRDRLLS